MAEAETRDQELVRAVAVAEQAVGLAPVVGDIRAAVQEVAGLGLGAAGLARELGQGQAAERPLAMAEPQNGFRPLRCYMARARAGDRELADLAVLAANMPLQKMTSARCWLYLRSSANRGAIPIRRWTRQRSNRG